MYLSFEQIRNSHNALADVHPFYLITFLACKAGSLPIGKAVHFPIDKKETEHLERYFRTDPSSKYFYRVSTVGPRAQRWLKEDYPSSGSQKTRTTTFKDAFIHDIGTDLWGWDCDYVNVLKSKLIQKKRIPAFHIAVWLYRNEKWSVKFESGDIQRRFFKDFHITKEERDSLFEMTVPSDLFGRRMFQDKAVSWRELQEITTRAPDVEPEEGGALSLLELHGIGPAKRFVFEPGDRINLITGDNALGKTFLLECAWWALSGSWAGLPAYPREDATRLGPKIAFRICSEYEGVDISTVKYDWETDSWPSPHRRPTIPGLIVYARVDGSFAVWDPARAHLRVKKYKGGENGAFIFSPNDIWNGLESKMPSKGEGRVLCNGILRDWITWQNSEDAQVFDTFCKALKRLSPTDLGTLEPGRPMRLLHDAREMPTIRHSYGTIPILHASAGVKRIVAIAYLLIWAWEEHKTQSRLLRKPAERRMVVLIDELEAHLHPQWQRLILPALADVCNELDVELRTQFIIGTHSPLVTASMEPLYNDKFDKLFHLSLEKEWNISDRIVTLKELPFIRHGRLDRWLTSEVFELSEARSIEAEKSIKAALKLQKKSKPKSEDVKRISDMLMQYLSSEDSFWPRWVCFAEKHGVEL